MDVKLVMFKPNGQRKDLPITKPQTVIGRSEECDLRVPLKSVSRKHCQILVGKDSLQVKDLGSSNGTYVNNKRVTVTDLKAGDRLVVGPTVFTVQVDGVPGEVQPVKTRGQKMAEAGEPGAEEIVDLEAEIFAKDEDAEGQDTGEAAAILSGADEEAGEQDKPVDLDTLAAETESAEVDPIAALEALAAESAEEEKEAKDKKK